MLVFGRLSVLLCQAVVSILVALLTASGHPQAFPCRLIQSTALCNNCQLSTVPAHLPPQTEEIYLDRNHLETLQDGCLSRYPALRTLSCANNHLRTLEENVFSQSPLVENLNFADNELHYEHKQVAQSLNSLTQLKTLDLSGNGLTEDMVSLLLQNLSSLETLYLSGNAMLRLDESTFQGLHQLKELNVERNLLFEIDGAFDHMTKLQRLNLAFNCLPCLVNFEMTQLRVLNASHNSIEWFITNQNMNETFKLETLDLSDNNLLFFPFLPTRNRIRTLILSSNWIDFYQRLTNDSSLNMTSVEYYNLGQNVGNVTADLWSESLHGDLSQVELLDLSENKVNYFPEGFIQQMPRLYWLKLRGNCLQSFGLTSEDLPVTVYELDVSKNRLIELRTSQRSISELNNLTHLNLSTNDLQNLPPRIFTSLPSLATVDLSHNPVGVCYSEYSDYMSSSECVAWSNMASLKHLYLADCSIQNIPSSAFKGSPLTHLELSNNPFLEINQESLASLTNTLQHLGLGNTGLQDFDFSPYSCLKSLNISKNLLSEIPASLMSLNLNLLDLRDNMLTTIPAEHAATLARRLQAVYMNGNAFNCCHLDWFRTFREYEGISVVDLSEITCLDLNRRWHKVMLFDAAFCGNVSYGESILWYILLFVSVSLSIVGISIIYMLTFKPKMLPRAIKKRCWKPTSY